MRSRPVPRGFSDFVAARGTALYRTAILLTRDHAAAEDLLQSALAKAWKAWDRIDGDHEAYTRRIIVNEFSSGWRRKWRGEVPTGALPTIVSEDHSEQVVRRQSLVAAVGALPPRQRAVVVLRYFHDYTEAQIAEALDVTTGTVKSQAAKALATLRVSEHLSSEPTPPGPDEPSQARTRSQS